MKYFFFSSSHIFYNMFRQPTKTIKAHREFSYMELKNSYVGKLTANVRFFLKEKQ